MTKNKKGFTIIEVVLVLAIAGLIFLMVFIALPALQRSQRNTRRRQDMARILSAFTEYESNNSGNVPTTNDQLDNFVNKYVNGGGTQNRNGNGGCYGDQFCDPDGSPYQLEYWGNQDDTDDTPFDDSSFAEAEHMIAYFTKASCSSTEGRAEYSSGARDIAILYMLEGGAIYCGDNQ